MTNRRRGGKQIKRPKPPPSLPPAPQVKPKMKETTIGVKIALSMGKRK